MMSKYYNKELPVEVHVMYGGRRSGATYREIEKLRKENEELKKAWEDANKSWERQVNKVGKAIKYIENNANYNDFFDDVTAGLSTDNCSELLKILKDGK